MYKVFRELFDETELITIEGLIIPSGRWINSQSISSGALKGDAYGDRVSLTNSTHPNRIPIEIRDKLMKAVVETVPDEYAFIEPWAINRYKAENKGHFYWHRDRLDYFQLLKVDMDRNISEEEIFVNNTRPQREMSVSVALTDRSEYNGGQFSVDNGDKRQTPIDLDRGDVAIFDSDTYHGVDDVTEGYRDALIVWLVHADKFEFWKDIREEAGMQNEWL
tara:strand:- start:7830 stop:8489 length:660 start_codon:yes stop_codon:yes gene_type:complete